MTLVTSLDKHWGELLAEPGLFSIVVPAVAGAVDAAIGRLIGGIENFVPRDEVLVVFAADHGESLGEHDYWGHGRYLYEPSLRIPLGIRWKGTVEQRVVHRQATILDIAPTVLTLLGIPVPESFTGISWAEAARGKALPPERTICYQAHKGAVHGELT